MKQETLEQREERKQMYMLQVARHSQGVDDETRKKVYKEAIKKFDEANPIKKGKT